MQGTRRFRPVRTVAAFVGTAALAAGMLLGFAPTSQAAISGAELVPTVWSPGGTATAVEGQGATRAPAGPDSCPSKVTSATTGSAAGGDDGGD